MICTDWVKKHWVHRQSQGTVSFSIRYSLWWYYVATIISKSSYPSPHRQWKMFGRHGVGMGELDNPYGIAIVNNIIYIAEGIIISLCSPQRASIFYHLASLYALGDWQWTTVYCMCVTVTTKLIELIRGLEGGREEWGRECGSKGGRRGAQSWGPHQLWGLREAQLIDFLGFNNCCHGKVSLGFY